MTGKRNNAVGPQIRARQQANGKLIPILAFLFLVAGLVTSTQFFAHDFGYQAASGFPLPRALPAVGHLDVG